MLLLEKQYLLLWPDLMLFAGWNDRPVKEHHHHCVQLVLALEQAFLTKNKHGDWEEKRALLIPPNVSHECDAKNKAILTLKFEAESEIGMTLTQSLIKDKTLIDLSDIPIVEQLQEIMAPLIQKKDLRSLRSEIISVLHQLFKLSKSLEKKDERIIAVVDYIKSHFDEKITTEDLMRIAFLSESRLLHLFKEQIGIPISHFLLWEKTKRAIIYAIQGHSLTEAAHYAGFSDAAHFSRTFQSRVGHPPSLIFKNSNSVQVFVSESP